jgi:hypothetical protein
MTAPSGKPKQLFWTSWMAQGAWNHPTAYLSGQVGDDCNWCQMVLAESMAAAQAWIRRQPGFIEERFCDRRDRIESSDRFLRVRAIRASATGAILSLPRRLRRACRVDRASSAD